MSLEDQITEFFHKTHPTMGGHPDRLMPGDLVTADWYNAVEDALKLLARELDALKPAR